MLLCWLKICVSLSQSPVQNFSHCLSPSHWSKLPFCSGLSLTSIMVMEPPHILSCQCFKHYFEVVAKVKYLCYRYGVCQHYFLSVQTQTRMQSEPKVSYQYKWCGIFLIIKCEVENTSLRCRIDFRIKIKSNTGNWRLACRMMCNLATLLLGRQILVNSCFVWDEALTRGTFASS